MSRGSRTIPLPEPVRRDNQPLGREIGHGENSSLLRELEYVRMGRK